MGNILIDRIRISGFRGLKDFQMSLTKTTVLTGINNAGKTTILKALQLALGSKSFLERDDFHMSQTETAEKIIIDIRIVQIGDDERLSNTFDDDWETLFKTDKIKIDNDIAYVPLRTSVSYNNLLSKFDIDQTILNYWDVQGAEKWQDIASRKQTFSIQQLPFFYVAAQRDIVEDMKLKTSYLGKMLADVAKEYNNEDIEDLENIIENLNSQAIERSRILTTIKDALTGINSAMDNENSCVELSPFSKKIRDLNKGVSIHYGESSNSFTMDYHGMGTRSWSSLLTLKAFITHSCNLAEGNGSLFFPIIAIEEPESHLHPNAQKKLYRQMAEMPGQKIISTHSPYIAASAKITEVNGLYKNGENIVCGNVDLSSFVGDEERKLRQKVINTKGELFFSKVIVLFEGETEEQALPILAEKFFGYHPSEIGVDFISVGGAGQYLPFLRFAEAFNIPWFIFSDGEVEPVGSMTKAVRKIRNNTLLDIQNESNIFIIENNEAFEEYILRCGYLNDILESYKSDVLSKCVNDEERQAKESEINSLTKENVLSKAVSHKTQWALIFANSIVKSQLGLPQLILSLFEEIKTKLAYE